MERTTEAISQSLQITFEALTGHSPDGAKEEFGSITAVSAGVPTPVFNRVFVFEPFETPNLKAAIDWFTDRGDPFWVTTLESLGEHVEDSFENENYEKSAPPQPGMARALTSDLPATNTDAEIDVVTQNSGLTAWTSVAESVFEFSDETNRLITQPSVLDDEDLQYLVGWVDGQPASCGMLALDDTVAGVYVIGVDEKFRRRGIGEAMTWQVLREGRNRGAEVAVLHSTQMAIPLYERMGFETKMKLRHFVRESWL